MLSILLSLAMGGIAGYVGSMIMGTSNNDWVKNVLVGLVGSIVGTIIGALIGLNATNIIGSLLLAILGSCVCIFVYNKYLVK